MSNELNSLKSDELVSLESELIKNLSFKDESTLKSKTIKDELDEFDSKIPQIVSEIELKLREFSNTKYIITLT